MRNPVCSVVVLTCDCPEYLPVAIMPAAAQREAGIETIVIDRGSSGSAGACLAKYRRECSALRIIEMEGAGAAQARNMGLAAARAPLLAFIDAVDWWWPDRLAEPVAYHAAHPETAFSFTDYLCVSPAGESLGSCFEYWQQPPLRRRNKAGYFRLEDALQILLATNLAGTSTVVANKNMLERAGGFRNLPSAEDWDLWLRLAAQAPVACSRAITVTHLVRAGYADSSRVARLAAMEEIASVYESWPASSVRHAAAKARARLDLARAALARSRGRHSSSARRRAPAFADSPPAKLGKETAARALNAALYFVGGYK